MALNQFRLLRSITWGAGLWPPANDTDWVPALTSPTPVNIPQLEFDGPIISSDAFGIAFYADMIRTDTNVRLGVTNQVYTAQLIEVANPVGITQGNVALAGCLKTGIAFYEDVLIPFPGAGIFGLRITAIGGTDPTGGAANGALRFFMRGL